MDSPPLGQVTALSIGEQLVNIMIRLSILSKETGLTAKAVIDKYADDPSTDEEEKVILKKLGALVLEASSMYDPPYESPTCSSSP